VCSSDLVRFSIEEGYNPGKKRTSFKTTFTVMYADPEKCDERSNKEGDEVFITECIMGGGSDAGCSRVKAMAISAAGFATEAEYDVFDPEQYFLEACTGEANEYSTEGQPLIGRLVWCLVKRGKLIGEGPDYYRNYAWAVVPEESQDVPACVEPVAT
jgi:hypothetical protein